MTAFKYFQNFLTTLKIPFSEKKFNAATAKLLVQSPKKIIERDVKSCYKNISKIRNFSSVFQNFEK